MTMLHTSLATLALACALAPASAASAQATPATPTPEQQKEIDAARDELQRAAKRLAELSGRYGGHGFGLNGPGLAGLAPARPVIGVLLAPDAQGGARISGVTPGGAADGAGLRSGDRLLRVNGKGIAGDSAEARVDAARALLQGLDEKTPVTLAYVRNGSEREVRVTPKRDTRMMVFSTDETGPGGRVVLRRVGESGAGTDDTARLGTPRVFAFTGDGLGGGASGAGLQVIRIDCKGDKAACEARGGDKAGATRDIQRAIVLGDCKSGEACKGPALLADAFRWSGLNLASVDAQLGRYFGTDKGVLVLSAGPALGTLQGGDVILRVDGKAVATPREVMDALRGKPADSSVPVDYLRDRAAGSARLKVPEQGRIPGLGTLDLDAARATATPGAHVHRRVMLVDRDGKVTSYEDGDTVR